MMTNANTPAYVARSAWSPARPETLVVCCSDGRWHAAILEFVRHAVSDRADLYAVPGGPAAFDPWNSSFEEARVLDQAVRMFAQYHDLHSVWLIQHQDCAYYRMKHPHFDQNGLESRQVADLRRAADVIRATQPNWNVLAIVASLQNGRAVFTHVDVKTDSGLRSGGSITTLL
jgi:hypothetical protein